MLLFIEKLFSIFVTKLYEKHRFFDAE